MPNIDPLVFSEAVRFFWQTRDSQTRKQDTDGKTDQGARSAVTGGKQMDGFIATLIDLMVGVGVHPEDIYVGRKGEPEPIIPGYYRATKGWDLLVVTEQELRAAIELKSQVGPSFGNNLNNRVEEALGSAEDLWTAYREGAFRTSKPWLGYVFLLEDCEKSRSAVAVKEPHFAVFPEFKGASYARRHELLCRKLVLERKYDAACFVMSPREDAHRHDNYTEPTDDLSAERFLRSLLGHLAPPV